MTQNLGSRNVLMLVAPLVLAFVVGILVLLEPASDRFRWVCEARGHLWVQPTHGEPYCGDGSGNPPDRNPAQGRHP